MGYVYGVGVGCADSEMDGPLTLGQQGDLMAPVSDSTFSAIDNIGDQPLQAFEYETLLFIQDAGVFIILDLLSYF